jgi:Helix-turn-helix
MFLKDGNHGIGETQRRFANLSGGNFSSLGSLCGEGLYMTTFQTLSTEDISNLKPLSAGDIEYYRHRLKNRVFEAVWEEFVKQFDELNLTKKSIANRLGKDPSQITRWLSGPSNLTMETVSDILLAMNCEPDITISSLVNRPIPNYIHAGASPTGGYWVSSSQNMPMNFDTATTGSRPASSWTKVYERPISSD